jgi:two-component system nitrogen regulation sensor histidine kinase NtrY
MILESSAHTESAPNRGVFRRMIGWARVWGLGRKAAILLTAMALVSVAATYAAITDTPPLSRSPKVILALLNIDLVLVLALGGLVVYRIGQLWLQRRRGLAGSELQLRLVVLFGAVALTPTLTIALIASLFINVGIERWFSDQVRILIDNSRAVAEAYLLEHEAVVRADSLAMANDLTRDPLMMVVNPQRFAQAVTTEAAMRSLKEVVVFDTTGRIRARSGFAFTLESEPPPPAALERARNGEVAIITGENDDAVRALVLLDRSTETYLYVARSVDPRVIDYVQQTRRAILAYRTLQGDHSGLQITFAVVFGVLAMLLLLAASWIGLNVATRLGRPIASLISAAEQVRTGDLSARVEESGGKDELASLSRAFNRMTGQLEAQRTELVEANQQLDMRRRFTETVLAGVSAGVIGLDSQGRINLPNRSASVLLSTDLDLQIGFDLGVVIPEMAELLAASRKRPDKRNEAQIRLVRERRPRILLTRVTAELMEGELKGFVVTFDDVTELMTAQRTAAWADVARRIAHEIKNPLTPIQLSAERLKRKYLKEITSDPETFIICTDTIVRQVGDIGRMVDEFSAFARLPAPVMKGEDVTLLAREAVFLLRNANPEITFELQLPEGALRVQCDARQISQAMINLLQNAVDAIAGRELTDEPLPPGRVGLSVRPGPTRTVIEITDNGKGLPVQERERLTEPYVTTRTKGTGLGLAIVKKIMEDHSGELILDDAPGGGARISLILPSAATDDSESVTASPVKVFETHGS